MNPNEIEQHGFKGLFGITKIDITPPVGIYARNWGAAKHDLADSVHRPFYVTALSIRSHQNDEPLVYVDADLGWWKTPQTARRFRQDILSDLKLADNQLILALTHTHAGPPLMEPDANLPGSELLSKWLDELYEKTKAAAEQAIGTTFEGTFDFRVGTCDLATHRDFPDPEEERILCGFEPEAKADQTLLVGRILDSQTKLRATFVNYACHPTTLAWENTSLSPDYIGAMRATLECNTDAPAIFGLGACGDLAPKVQYQGNPQVADLHGKRLGHAALSTLFAMDPPATSYQYEAPIESGASLAIWTHQPRTISESKSVRITKVKLPLKDWDSAEELERQRTECDDRAIEERLRRKRDIRRYVGDGQYFELELFVWRIGEVIFAGSCCEPYSILQTELRRLNRNHTIVCLNLINGSIGYLPPSDLYEHNVYPVWQTPFAKGSLEIVIDALDATIKEVIDDA